MFCLLTKLKEKNLKNPFDKFPNCKLHSIELTPDENKRGKYSPYYFY